MWLTRGDLASDPYCSGRWAGTWVIETPSFYSSYVKWVVQCAVYLPGLSEDSVRWCGYCVWLRAGRRAVSVLLTAQ